MDVLGDLVARDRRSGRPAFTDAGTDRSISYRDFCTTAYKAGNVLRYLGVREEATVGVVGPIGPQPLWAFYGAAQLGAVTWFTGDTAVDEDLLESEPRVVVLPVSHEESVDPGPSTKVAVYGGAPARPTTLHWEKELWSENPAVHPTDVDSADPFLSTGEETYTHGEALESARAVVERVGLDADTRVVVRGSLSDPRVVVAGLVAPILAGGTVVAPMDGPPAGDVAVVDAGNAPENRVCRADDVLL
ncbi:AMP-binding protein [Salinigranum salinum]|uniref:AMP-binding protein n=1 Tax=Salinigranum salinum TaxID=1364937 RepID=UPI001260B442|nr:AMP-binding protein [Salinigranum salinum]